MACWRSWLLTGLWAVSSLCAASPWLWVTNQASNSVSVVDAAQGRVVDTIAVGHSPAGVVVVQNQQRVFISNPDSHDITVIDGISHAVIASLPVAGAAVGMAASADGQWLAAADWYRNEVVIFAVQTLKPQAVITVGHAPAGLAFDPAGSRLFVANRDDDRIGVINLWAKEASTVKEIAVGTHPFGLAISADGQWLYSANVMSNDVSVVSLAKNQEVARIPVGSSPYCIALDEEGGRAFVSNQHGDSVTVIDTRQHRPIATWPTGGYPEGLAYQRGQLWVVQWMDDNLALLDGADGHILRTIPLQKNPRGFGVMWQK
jgi:YVTN family beta-propeller protein